jgi:hypothetical protein
MDVIHGDIDPVSLPPLLSEVVEPYPVIPGYEVGPLQDLQPLLGRVRLSGNEDGGTRSRCQYSCTGSLDKIPSGNGFFNALCHDVLLSQRNLGCLAEK